MQADPEMETYLKKQEFKFYNTLLNDCFKDCIYSFGSTKLAESEKKCLENCFLKSLSSVQRVSEAYQFAAQTIKSNP
jgi:hypothetical protein